MLTRKLLRDLRLSKTQFLSIFLMSFLGVYIFAGMNAEWMGMQKNLDNYVAKTNFANMWVVGENFSTDDAKKVEAIDGVSKADRRLVADATAELENNPTVRLNFAEKNDVSSCYTVKGEDFSTEKDGIWINEYFAKARNLSVGDTITLKCSELTLKEKIRGIIVNPEYIFTVKDETQLMPDNKKFGFAFLSSKEFPTAAKITYNQLIVDTAEKANASAVEDKIHDLFKGRSTVVLNRDSQSSYLTFQSEIKQNRSMGEIFPMVFLLISVLAIITTMTRITARQRTQIGTLKALGFSNRKITFHYISYSIYISLVSGILGVILGPATIPQLIYNSQKEFYSIPFWDTQASPIVIVIVAVSVLVSTAACYFACRKELRDPPAETLKPLAPKMSRLSKLEKSKLWKKLGFSTQWNFRDIRRNRIRSLMGAISIAGCMTLLICAFACKDSISAMSDRSFRELMRYESKILLSATVSDNQIENLKTKYDGQLIEEQPIEIAAGNKKKTASLAVLGNGSFLNFQDDKGSNIKLTDSGIALSYKMAEVLGIQIGDEISWHVYGNDKWKTGKVQQFYKTPTGQGIAMTSAAFAKGGDTFHPTSILSGKSVDASLKTDEIVAVQNKKAISESFDEQMQFVNLVIAVLATAATILGSVMIYNLGIISFSEKSREIAVLKVLGFKVRKIRNLLQKQNIWITAFGIVLGIPMGLGLIAYIMTASMPDTWDVSVVISPLSWLISVAGTFILSVLVTTFLSRKVKSIHMVEALKALE